MSHGVKRAKQTAEKEAARKDKERAQIQEYRALTEDVMTRVTTQNVPMSAHPLIEETQRCLQRSL